MRQATTDELAEITNAVKGMGESILREALADVIRDHAEDVVAAELGNGVTDD